MVNITEANEILIDNSVVDVTCGGNNGSASLIVTGGTSPYYYLWSNDSTTSTINNLLEGTYDVTVTDDLGCSVVSSVIIGNSGGTLSTSISNILGLNTGLCEAIALVNWSSAIRLFIFWTSSLASSNAFCLSRSLVKSN